MGVSICGRLHVPGRSPAVLLRQPPLCSPNRSAPLGSLPVHPKLPSWVPARSPQAAFSPFGHRLYVVGFASSALVTQMKPRESSR